MFFPKRPVLPWQEAARVWLALLDDHQLSGLADGLANDDIRLLQGATTIPAPGVVCSDWPIEGVDPIGYAGVVGGLTLVGEVEVYWVMSVCDIDREMGWPGAVTALLSWWDEGQRDVVRRELLGEVERVILGRRALAN